MCSDSLRSSSRRSVSSQGSMRQGISLINWYSVEDHHPCRIHLRWYDQKHTMTELPWGIESFEHHGWTKTPIVIRHDRYPKKSMTWQQDKIISLNKQLCVYNLPCCDVVKIDAIIKQDNGQLVSFVLQSVFQKLNMNVIKNLTTDVSANSNLFVDKSKKKIIYLPYLTLLHLFIRHVTCVFALTKLEQSKTLQDTTIPLHFLYLLNLSD